MAVAAVLSASAAQRNEQGLRPKVQAKAKALVRASLKADPVKNDDLRRSTASSERDRSSGGCCLVGGEDYGCGYNADGLSQSVGAIG